MSTKGTLQAALQAIDRTGVILVFPIDNARDPHSLWYHLHPRTRMRWEWDESGDNRVGNLWHLRCQLSTTRKTVYAKWFRGRATLFSLKVFPDILRALNPDGARGLSTTAGSILRILEAESPISTKELKRMTGLKGRANEAAYEKALKELWSRLLIVGFGEVDDGAFPSLAVGATQVLFESLWEKAFSEELAPSQALARAQKALGEKNLFYKQLCRLASTQYQIANQVRDIAYASAPARPASMIRFEDLAPAQSRFRK